MKVKAVGLPMAVLLSLSLSAQTDQKNSLDIRTGVYNGKRVTFEVVDGLAIVEGDIILGTAKDLELPESGQQVIEKPKDYQPKALVLADFLSGWLWPEGVVPYTIDESLPNPQRVLDAIEHWNSKSTIRLVERTDEPDWVNFTVHEERCTSFVGRRGGEQEITVPEWCSIGGIIHEIGHTVGLFHEHSREDSDSHVRVFFENIDKRSILINYTPVIKYGDDIGPYDYGSIMHYDGIGFSRNNKPTIETIPPGLVIGQREGLSAGDIDGVAELYGHTTNKTTISTNPEGLEVEVDGISIVTPRSFDWSPGTHHTIAVAESRIRGNERFLFGRWSDGGEREHSIIASEDTKVFTAHMIQQFKLQSGAQPSDGGDVIVVPASPDGFYTNRSFVVVDAVPREGYSFAWWAGLTWTGLHGLSGNPVEVPVRVDGLNYTARFTTEQITTISTNAPGRRAMIDGQELRLPMNFPWAANSTHSIGVTDVVQPGPYGVSRWVFRDWSDGGGQTHTITVPNRPSTITANFGEQHLLTKKIVLSDERGSIYASPASDDGFFDAGTSLQLTADPATGYRFTFWANVNGGRLSANTFDNPTTLTIDEQGWIAAGFTLSRLLISGAAPREFSLPPVVRPTFFSGRYSFTVNIPEGATGLRVNLTTQTAGVDVDLHVNHGSEAALSDEGVVSEYSSTGPFGNESVYITRRTDPPLRAGTYFISFTLYTTGKRVEATISATVE